VTKPIHERLIRPLWFFIAAGLFLGIMFAVGTVGPSPGPAMLTYSGFISQIDANAVRSVNIDAHIVHGVSMTGKKFDVNIPDGAAIVDRLLQHHVEIEFADTASGSSGWSWLALLSMIAPVLLLLLFFGAYSRKAGLNRRGDVLGFGKSPARLYAPEKKKVTLADVAGIDEAEEELKEIVEFLKSPDKFQRLGGKMPKGCMLVGPPGSGKTLLARAIAGEANVPFYSISGSDFVEMFVGVGAARVRDMFQQAKQNAPCIIFVDEIDAVGRRRGTGTTQTNDEREQTLNQLLVELDGFDPGEGVIVLAATNRPDILDPALLRPGRFDRQIVLSNPDIVGRQQILNVHLRHVPVGSDVDVSVLARGTPGFSGADLANLVNEAALLAARRDKQFVTMAEFEQAKDKVLMGAERRSLIMTEKEKHNTAYHEAGHALVSFFTPGSDPLHKITIIPRGHTLGATMSLPERDRHGFSKSELDARIAVMFGGRAAEELVFGNENATTGAADDVRQATELARRMVVEFGFSTKLGPVSYPESETAVTGFFTPQMPPLSEETVRLIDEETRRIVEEAKLRAETLIRTHLVQLHALAAALLEKETLNRSDIESLLSSASDMGANGAPRALITA
jgi:cell division protease FtsH